MFWTKEQRTSMIGFICDSKRTASTKRESLPSVDARQRRDLVNGARESAARSNVVTSISEQSRLLADAMENHDLSIATTYIHFIRLFMLITFFFVVRSKELYSRALHDHPGRKRQLKFASWITRAKRVGEFSIRSVGSWGLAIVLKSCSLAVPGFWSLSINTNRSWSPVIGFPYWCLCVLVDLPHMDCSEYAYSKKASLKN